MENRRLVPSLALVLLLATASPLHAAGKYPTELAGVWVVNPDSPDSSYVYLNGNGSYRERKLDCSSTEVAKYVWIYDSSRGELTLDSEMMSFLLKVHAVDSTGRIHFRVNLFGQDSIIPWQPLSKDPCAKTAE